MKLSMGSGYKFKVRQKIVYGLLTLTAGLFSVNAQALECGLTPPR